MVSEVSPDPIAALWQNVLRGVFTVMGRLAAISRHRIAYADIYHIGRMQDLRAATAYDAVCRVHELVWMDWSAGSLDEQQIDLLLYFRSLSKRVEAVAQIWKETQPFLAFAPDSASDVERASFSRRMSLLLEALGERAPNDSFLTLTVSGVATGKSATSCGESAHISEPRLSARETEVLLLIKQGNTSKEIAHLMNLSTETVASYRKSICKKLDVHSTAGLASYQSLPDEW